MPNVLDKPNEGARSAVGTGVYALADLRAFMALSGEPADARRVSAWLHRILHPATHHAYQADYNFADLVSLFVVRQLLHEGVPARNIHKAEGYLREKWRTERPFLRSREIETDGRHVFVDRELISGQIESADELGQQALLEPIRSQLRGVRFDKESHAALFWLPEPDVLVDPRVQFGEPVIRGTRLATAVVAAMARTLGPHVTAERLATPLDNVQVAVAFEERLAKAREN